MYFFYFLYKIPKNIYKDRSRTGLGTDLYTVLGPSNGPVQSSPGQKTGLLGPGPDRTGPIHLYDRVDLGLPKSTLSAPILFKLYIPIGVKKWRKKVTSGLSK